MRISDWSSDVCSSDLRSTHRRSWPACGRCRRRSANRQARRPRRPGGRRRSEERRVGKSVSVRVDLGGRRIIKKKKKQEKTEAIENNNTALNSIQEKDK